MGDLAIPFTVNTNTTAKVIVSARDAVAKAASGDWQTANRAANFAFNSGMNEDAARWVDASIKAKPTPSNLYLKARMQAKAGQNAAAIQTAEQALKLTTDKDKELPARSTRPLPSGRSEDRRPDRRGQIADRR